MEPCLLRHTHTHTHMCICTHAHTHIKSHACVSKVMFIVFLDNEGLLLLYFQSCTETPGANNYYLTLEILCTKIKNTSG